MTERDSLVPLRCPTCGRPVPLGIADTARCSACGAEVAIPEAYVALRSAAAMDDSARARAEALGAELARPPSFFVRFWLAAGSFAFVLAILLLVVWLGVSLIFCIGTFVDAGPAGALVMLVVGFVLGLPLLYDEVLHGLAGPLQIDLADVLGGASAYGLLGLGCWLLTAVPLVLAAYADAFEAVRVALRTALAANPAAMGGGPDECRSCGAPLEIRGDHLHARCVYCGADNLVHLGHARVESIADDMVVASTDLESAIALETSTARSERRRAVGRLAKALALIPLTILLGRCVAAVNDTDATFWHRAVATAPMLPNQADNPVLARGVSTSFAVRDTFDGCDDRECWAYYYVPLAASQVPQLAADPDDVHLAELARRDLGPWYDPTYQWRAIDLDAGAPHAGWFRVRLVKPRDRVSAPAVTWTATR